MAIITEYFMTREDGVVLNRTYSNKGMLIERDGVQYEEAVDPADVSRVYTETDAPIPVSDPEPEPELVLNLTSVPLYGLAFNIE
jgi:hypothetical protein